MSDGARIDVTLTTGRQVWLDVAHLTMMWTPQFDDGGSQLTPLNVAEYGELLTHVEGAG